MSQYLEILKTYNNHVDKINQHYEGATLEGKKRVTDIHKVIKKDNYLFEVASSIQEKEKVTVKVNF